MPRVAQPPLKGDSLNDFSGGPNPRDATAGSQLAANEVADSFNITYDERGGASSRLGGIKDNATPFSGGLVQNEEWSAILGAKITQAGSSLYLGTTNTARKTFSTSELVTFAEMNNLVVACHPTDGLFTSSDGITWTAVADVDAPKATCVAAWQSKLWAADHTGKVSWSAVGDATGWTSTDFNKLWEKDQQGIVAMHIGSGQDVRGRPGLLCFKNESVYRINDSSTGAYDTIDATVGAAGPKAVTGVGAKVLLIGKRGIFWWREDQTGMVDASDRFAPLWRDQTNLAQQSLWCAGRKGNRAFFSLTRAGSTANDLAFEYHTEQNWLAPRSNAMTCYATATGSGGETLYGGSPSVSGQSYQLETGGNDDGVAISWRIQTRWLIPNAGFRASVWQVRIHGRGAGTFTVRRNYASAGGDAKPFDLTGTAATYDSGLKYDASNKYAEPTYQNTQPFYSIGVCRQFSLIFSGSSTTTYTAPQILDVGTNPEIGYFAIYGIEWLFTQLGLS